MKEPSTMLEKICRINEAYCILRGIDIKRVYSDEQLESALHHIAAAELILAGDHAIDGDHHD